MPAAPTVTVRLKSAVADIPGEGTHVVGTDIESGAGRTVGASDPGLPLACWALEGYVRRLRRDHRQLHHDQADHDHRQGNRRSLRDTGCEVWHKVS